MTAAVVDTTLGEFLSLSQGSFLVMRGEVVFPVCARAERTTGWCAGLGTAFHLRWRTTFRQKIETKQDLPKETLQESFTQLPVEGTIAGALVQGTVDLDVEE
jgi:hypothetical protein